ncbi:unnamed protein product [Moneuplotes crassus]|uniref:Uncharacterized protein n=1 Tax=Euplotes crassus TaxID=5936 RepID=A0AAD2CZY9_EUPCR|nr:unnamed protein product [Moneuplotes crassus]
MAREYAQEILKKSIPSIPINTESEYFLLATWFCIGSAFSMHQMFKNDDAVLLKNIRRELPYLKPLSQSKSSKAKMKNLYKKEVVKEIYKVTNFEIKKYLFNRKSQLRQQRLDVLKKKGMNEYINEIKSQFEIQAQIEKRIFCQIFSCLDQTPGLFLKRLNKVKHEPWFMDGIDNDHIQAQLIQQKIKNNPLEITDEKLHEMSEWSEEMEVRMVKQIIRKTADQDDLDQFQNQVEITNICRRDDFFQTFEQDEDEVKAFVQMKEFS